MQQQQQQNATTYAARLDRYSKQRDEWVYGLQMLITPAVEQTLRKLWRASELCVQMQPNSMNIDDAYNRLLANSRTWSDQEMRTEIGEKKADDADVSLQMVVKSHATVLALATARRCRQVISVPSIIKFFRTVLETCATELSQAEFFCTFDIDMRAKVRRWIDQIVRTQALAIVPVGMFAKAPSVEEQHPPKLRALQRAIERVEADTDFSSGIPMQEIVQEPIAAAVVPATQVVVQEPPVPSAEPEPMTAAVPVYDPIQEVVKSPSPVIEEDVMSNTSETLDIAMPPPGSPHGSPRRSHSPAMKSDDEEEEAYKSEGDEPI